MSTILVGGLGSRHLLTQGYGPTGTSVPLMATAGTYVFAGTGGAGVCARAVPPTPQVPMLRSFEKSRIFRLDFAPDVTPGVTVASAQVAVFARPEQYEPGATTDVTTTLLVGQINSGTSVSAILDNANAVPRTIYSVRFVATMASGETAEEIIDPIICDM